MSGGRDERCSWRLIGRPLFLVSVGVLVVNDHFLKATYPGSITGKLSDVAGVVVVGTIAAVLFGRTRGLVLVGLGFIALLRRQWHPRRCDRRGGQRRHTGGFGDETFRPVQPVTRGQMATFLARAIDL